MYLFVENAKFLPPLTCSSKKVESEGGASAAKKDSKRKRELSVSDDVEVKSPLLSPPEDEDDDGVQVRARQGEALIVKQRQRGVLLVVKPVVVMPNGFSKPSGNQAVKTFLDPSVCRGGRCQQASAVCIVNLPCLQSRRHTRCQVPTMHRQQLFSFLVFFKCGLTPPPPPPPPPTPKGFSR